MRRAGARITGGVRIRTVRMIRSEALAGRQSRAFLFCFFVGLVAFAGLAILAELQTYLQLRVAGGVVVVSAAFCAFHADHGLLWHRKMR